MNTHSVARKCNLSSEKEFFFRSLCIFLFLALIDVSPQVIYEEGSTFMISCAFINHTRTPCTCFLSYFRRRFQGDSTFTAIAYRQMNNSGIPGIDLYRHNETGVQFQSVTCKDSGIYICEVNCRPLESMKPSNLVFRNSQYIYVTVPPGPTTITAFPNITNYQSDTILELTCNASFGTNYLIEKKEWRWEFKDNVSNKWIQYTLLKDIINGPDYKDPLMECKMSQASKLTIVLTMGDNKRKYRCYVTQKAKNGSDVEYTSHASVFYIPHVMQADLERSVNPGRTVLTAFPMKHTYEVNTKLEIACRATIGSDAVDVETEWFWEYNDYTRPDWREYSGHTNVHKDLIYEDRQVKGRILQVSRVRRTLLLEDSKRKYRCYIWIKHGKSPWIKYDQFASVFFIRHVRDPTKEINVTTPRLDVLIGGLLGGVVLLTSSVGFLLFCKGALDRKRKKEIESETKYKLSVKCMERRMVLENRKMMAVSGQHVVYTSHLTNFPFT